MFLSAVKLQSGVFVFFFAATVPAVLLFTANKRQSGSVPSRQAPRRGKNPASVPGTWCDRLIGHFWCLFTTLKSVFAVTGLHHQLNPPHCLEVNGLAEGVTQMDAQILAISKKTTTN